MREFAARNKKKKYKFKNDSNVYLFSFIYILSEVIWGFVVNGGSYGNDLAILSRGSSVQRFVY